jgi:hypothetical protein
VYSIWSSYIRQSLVNIAFQEILHSIIETLFKDQHNINIYTRPTSVDAYCKFHRVQFHHTDRRIHRRRRRHQDHGPFIVSRRFLCSFRSFYCLQMSRSNPPYVSLSSIVCAGPSHISQSNPPLPSTRKRLVYLAVTILVYVNYRVAK